MAEISLSEGEKLFIIHSTEDDCRIDGRKCLESRGFSLETSVIPLCNGSSHVRLGKTDILVGIKAQIEGPNEDTPDEGRIEFFADCSANASPAFEGRGGEGIANELVTILSKSFLPCLDLKQLCLCPSKSVWSLTIDILILEFGSKSSLFDAAGLAVKAALVDLRIPRVIFDQEVDELEVPEDPSDLVTLDTSRVPVLVTLTKLGTHYVIDATENEEAASVSSVVFAVSSDESLIHTKKVGSGALYIPPLKEDWTYALNFAKTLHHDLLNCLSSLKRTK